MDFKNIIIKIENNQVVSLDELNQVLAVPIYKQLIEIQLQNQFDRIDIVFIAGLILYAKTTESEFNLNYAQPNFEKIFEVRQYLKQYETLYNQITIKTKGITLLGQRDYVSSKSFAPILFVNDETIGPLFTETEENVITPQIYNLCEKYRVERLISQNQIEYDYLSSEDSIVSTLQYYAPIYTFVFTILFNKINPFVNPIGKGISDPKKRTIELWEFTKEYVRGLHELAKNIVEHSTNKQGMITIRVYGDEMLSEPNLSPDKVLETYVFDFGTDGIIEKLKKETKSKVNDNKIYKEDFDLLNDQFSLKDLISPITAKKLNQQLYRELAHYGLIKFYRLIEKNEGTVISGSIDADGKRDVFSNTIPMTHKSINLGTAYFFQLPFKHELFGTEDNSEPPGTMQGSPNTISGLHELMDIAVLDSKNLDDTLLPPGKLLVNFELTGNIDGRNAEMNLFEIFKPFEGHIEIAYFALNLKFINLSASSLLRLLANLSINYSQPIILYNLDFETYDEMIEDNIQFYLTLKDLEHEIPYWYEGKSILAYTKVKGFDFNFADILYGNNLSSFISVNKILGHTFPNATTIIRNADGDQDPGIDVPEGARAFFFSASLLPFDLLLNNETDKSLFQTNLTKILEQELITTRL